MIIYHWQPRCGDAALHLQNLLLVLPSLRYWFVSFDCLIGFITHFLRQGRRHGTQDVLESSQAGSFNPLCISHRLTSTFLWQEGQVPMNKLLVEMLEANTQWSCYNPWVLETTIATTIEGSEGNTFAMVVILDGLQWSPRKSWQLSVSSPPDSQPWLLQTLLHRTSYQRWRF